MGQGCVPGTPERAHLFREAQRNSNVLRESRKSGGHQNTLGAEDLRDFVARAADGHEHEIRLRIEPPKHARVGLIEKLLAMIFVERGNLLDVGGIEERCAGGASTAPVLAQASMAPA